MLNYACIIFNVCNGYKYWCQIKCCFDRLLVTLGIKRKTLKVPTKNKKNESSWNEYFTHFAT